MKKFIAEDDTRLLKSLLHIFALNKFSADGVSDGKEALEYARTGEYDGLVLDIMMPEWASASGYGYRKELSCLYRQSGAGQLCVIQCNRRRTGRLWTG